MSPLFVFKAMSNQKFSKTENHQINPAWVGFFAEVLRLKTVVVERRKNEAVKGAHEDEQLPEVPEGLRLI